MAKARRLEPSPVVRSIARNGVRAGRSNAEIEGSILGSFPNMDEDAVTRVVENERARQEVVEGIEAEDKRKRVDLARRLKCPAGTNRVRMRITITWTDPETGETHTFGDTVEGPARGRLQDIINAALDRVLASARAKGYDPAHVRSSDLAGSARYRIEYVECV